MKRSFGQPPLANETDFAVSAVLGQRVSLVCPKFSLECRIHHVSNRRIYDISKMVSRKNVVVAGVEITVVLNRHRIAAGFAENAEAWIVTHPCLECNVEDLYVDFPDVVHHPLVKNSTQKLAVLSGLNRALRDLCSGEMFDSRIN